MTEPQLISYRDIGGLFGVSNRTARSWCEGLAPDMPGGNGAPNKFTLMRVIEHHFLVRGTPEGEQLDLDQERARQAKEQADKLGMANAVERGELVRMSSIEEHWGRELGNVRAALMALPRKCAPRVVGIQRMPEIEAVIETAVREALEPVTAEDAGIPSQARRVGQP
jgi:phage terminase Nu1 subunit (DNA packaging protein)